VVVNNPIQLHSDRLVLRPLMESDRDAFIALLRVARESLSDFFPLHRAGEGDEQVFERHAAFSRAALATGRAWRRVLCLRDGRIIGSLNLNDITARPVRSAELNMWLAPAYQAMGLAAEAIALAMQHALLAAPGGLALDRVWGYVAPANSACIRTITRAGFQRDAASLPVQLNLDGRWVTHHVYQLMPPVITTRRAPSLRLVTA
jgi:RimJ/RimL family protein N-acetyltransferase